MINLSFLEANKEKLRSDYLLAKPFPYLVIDNFCDKDKVGSLYKKIPELNNKSRDYIFAKNDIKLPENSSPVFIQQIQPQGL